MPALLRRNRQKREILPTMSAFPLVSIVVASHDAAGWLPQSLASARAQTLRDIEILVVDDGSTDATPALLHELAAAEPRLRPLRRDRRGGPSAARNLALDHARGRWVALLDADDAFLPERLTRLVALAERRGAELMADDLLLEDVDQRVVLGRHLGTAAIAAAPQPLGLADFIARDMSEATHGESRAIGYLKPLLCRDFLERHRLRFDEQLQGGEDFCLYAEALAAGGRFFLADEAHYVYRLRSGSLSSRPGMARQLALANRRVARRAREVGDQAAMALLARRQRALDRAALADAADAGAWHQALALARWRRPALLAEDLRILGGAAARRLGRPGAAG